MYFFGNDTYSVYGNINDSARKKGVSAVVIRCSATVYVRLLSRKTVDWREKVYQF